jgi:hypothetical protein
MSNLPVLPPMYPAGGSGGGLTPAPVTVTTPTLPASTGSIFDSTGKDVPHLYTYVMAMVGYLAVISFMPPKAAAALSLLLILGALYVNQKSRGGLSIFNTLGLPNT